MIGSSNVWSVEQVECLHEAVSALRKHPSQNPVFVVLQLIQNGKVIHNKEKEQ